MSLSLTSSLAVSEPDVILTVSINQSGDGAVGWEVVMFTETDKMTNIIDYAGSENTTISITIHEMPYPNECTIVSRVRGKKSDGTYTDWSNYSTATNETIPASSYPADYLPSYSNIPITTQAVYIDGVYKGQAGSCVANATSTLLRILNYKRAGAVFEASIAWIYGNRKTTDTQGEGMYVEEALTKLIEDGCPNGNILSPATIGTLFYSDLTMSIDAKRLVGNNYTDSILSASRNHKIVDYQAVDRRLSNTEILKQRIANDGGILIHFHVSFTFYYIKSDGIFIYPDDYPPNSDGASSPWHVMAVDGWKTINGKLHWRCRNSWDTTWGASGFCYIPADSPIIRGYYCVHDIKLPEFHRFDNIVQGQEIPNVIINSKMYAKIIPAADWNALIDALLAFRDYSGQSSPVHWVPRAASFVSETSCTKFTHDMYNDMIYFGMHNFCIAKGIPYTLTEVQQGEVITAKRIKDLQDVYNALVA